MGTRRVLWLVVASLGLTACRSAGVGATDHARNGCYEYSISADRDQYRGGQAVHLTVEARNVTSRSCLGHVCGGITSWIEVLDDHGRSVYRTNPVGILCRRPAGPPPRVAAGRGTVWETFTWPPEGTDPPSPGRYTARWHWLDDVSVSSPAIIVTRA